MIAPASLVHQANRGTPVDVRRAVSFLIPLIAGLALLAIIGHAVLTRTTSTWFEKDLALRSRLAIDSASTSLASHWSAPAELAKILGDITRDERIMAAAACSPRDELIVATAA
jgi:trehalose 6-phosphate synthase